MCLNFSCILSTCVCVCVCACWLFLSQWNVFASVGTDRFSGLTSSLLICLSEHRHQQKHCGCLQTAHLTGGTVFYQLFLVYVIPTDSQTWGQSLESSIQPLSLSPRCQVAHIVLSLDAKLYYQWILEPRWLLVGWEQSIVAGVRSS